MPLEGTTPEHLVPPCMSLILLLQAPHTYQLQEYKEYKEYKEEEEEEEEEG